MIYSIGADVKHLKKIGALIGGGGGGGGSPPDKIWGGGGGGAEHLWFLSPVQFLLYRQLIKLICFIFLFLSKI